MSAIEDVDRQFGAIERGAVEGDLDGAYFLRLQPVVRGADFDGDTGRLTELDALIAYLQILGRMVDFTDVTAEDLKQ